MSKRDARPSGELLVFVGALVLLLGGGGAYAEPSVRDITEAVRPVVVSITAEVPKRSRASGSGASGFFRHLVSPRYDVGHEVVSNGAGLLLDDGYVVTNHHVVARGDLLRVTLFDGTAVVAEHVGEVADLDIALLRIAAPEYRGYPLAEARDVALGESVVAGGNPYGLGPTFTAGVVSARHRDVQGAGRVYHDMVQTDASLNPGNSGGPLFALDGSFVGLNTAIMDTARGIGFAIPARRVQRLVRELVVSQRVRPAYFGMTLRETREGMVIDRIAPGGPADRAGLAPGMHVRLVDGYPVPDRAAFARKARDLPPGSALVVEVDSPAGRLTRHRLVTDVLDRGGIDALLGALTGASLRALEVVSTPTDGPLVVGDAVVSVNGIAASDDTFADALLGLRDRDSATLRIARNGRFYDVTFSL